MWLAAPKVDVIFYRAANLLEQIVESIFVTLVAKQPLRCFFLLRGSRHAEQSSRLYRLSLFPIGLWDLALSAVPQMEKTCRPSAVALANGWRETCVTVVVFFRVPGEHDG